MKTDQQQQARNLFINTSHTREQIAQTVGVDKKTLYRWIKQEYWDEIKQATLALPSLIVHNLFSQVAELQQHIASREEGQRFPTMQEAEVMRKLVNTAQKMGLANSLSTNIQVMTDFTGYTLQQDLPFTQKMVRYADQYFKDHIKKPKNKFPHNFFLAEREKLENENAGKPLEDGPNDEDIEQELPQPEVTPATEIIPDEEGISSPPHLDSPAGRHIQPIGSNEKDCPPQGTTGHSLPIIPVLWRGIRYIGNGMVYVPHTKMKRSMHISEQQAYKELGFTIPQLNDIIKASGAELPIKGHQKGPEVYRSSDGSITPAPY